MGTSGSEGGQQKPTSREAGRALLPDPYSEHPTGEGKLYLCAVKDVFSNRIVGYSISDRMKSRLAVDALTSAVVRRAVEGADTTGCVVHSDSETAGAGAPSVPDPHSDRHAKMSVPGAPRVS